MSTKKQRELRAAGQALAAASRKTKKSQNERRYRKASFDEKIRRWDAGLGVARNVATTGAEIIGTIGGAMAMPTSGMTALASPVGGAAGISVSAPSANGYVTSTGRPRGITKHTITHRELIGSFTATGNDFEVLLDQPINPGNSNLFPWLSQISCRYQQFRFKKLTFIYEPSSGTQKEGSLYQAIDYNVQDDAPISNVNMMSYEGATKSPVWFPSCMSATSEGLNQSKSYYTAYGVGGLPPDSDPKTYFPGQFILAQQGAAADQTLGEVYVDYSVTLSTPQLSAQCLQSTIEWSTDTPDFIDPTGPFFSSPSVRGNMGATITAQTQGNGTTTQASAYVSFESIGQFLVFLIGFAETGGDDWAVSADGGSVVQLLGSDNPIFFPAVTIELPAVVAFKLEILEPGQGFNIQADSPSNFTPLLVQMMAVAWDFSLIPDPLVPDVDALTKRLSLAQYLRFKNGESVVPVDKSLRLYTRSNRKHCRDREKTKDHSRNVRPVAKAAKPVLKKK